MVVPIVPRSLCVGRSSTVGKYRENDTMKFVPLAMYDDKVSTCTCVHQVVHMKV